MIIWSLIFIIIIINIFKYKYSNYNYIIDDALDDKNLYLLLMSSIFYLNIIFYYALMRIFK